MYPKVKGGCGTALHLVEFQIAPKWLSPFGTTATFWDEIPWDTSRVFARKEGVQMRSQLFAACTSVLRLSAKLQPGESGPDERGGSGEPDLICVRKPTVPRAAGKI